MSLWEGPLPPGLGSLRLREEAHDPKNSLTSQNRYAQNVKSVKISLNF